MEMCSAPITRRQRKMKKLNKTLGCAEWHKGMADAVARAAERLEAEGFKMHYDELPPLLPLHHRSPSVFVLPNKKSNN